MERFLNLPGDLNRARAQREVREDLDCHSRRDCPKTRDFRFPEQEF